MTWMIRQLLQDFNQHQAVDEINSQLRQQGQQQWLLPAVRLMGKN